MSFTDAELEVLDELVESAVISGDYASYAELRVLYSIQEKINGAING